MFNIRIYIYSIYFIARLKSLNNWDSFFLHTTSLISILCIWNNFFSFLIFFNTHLFRSNMCPSNKGDNNNLHRITILKILVLCFFSDFFFFCFHSARINNLTFLQRTLEHAVDSLEYWKLKYLVCTWRWRLNKSKERYKRWRNKNCRTKWENYISMYTMHSAFR